MTEKFNNAEQIKFNVCLMGVSLTTYNMGVSALAVSLVKKYNQLDLLQK